MNRCGYILALFVVILAGCVPTRYAWSPDGKWMTVVGEDGLHIARADGELLPGVLAGVGTASWFPDSNRLVVCRQIDVATWNELAKYVSPADAQVINKFSSRLSAFIQNYDWAAPNAGTWKAFQTAWTRQESPSERADEEAHRELGIAVALYLRDHATQAMREKIPAARWVELTLVTQAVKSVEVCNVGDTAVGAGKPIMTSLKNIHDLRVSPSGAAVLVSTDGSAAHDSDLYVISADGSRPPVLLSNRASWYADWSPNGRDVFFIRATAAAQGDERRLASLSRARIFDDQSALAEQPPTPEDMATVQFTDLARVRCLKNGRVLFVTADVKLPAATGDAADHVALFSMNPDQQAAIVSVIPDNMLLKIGDDIRYFEVSPDEKHLSIPDSTGKVYVADLETGGITEAQPLAVMNSENKPELLSVPQWRNNDELTFVAPDVNNRPSVQVWSVSSGSSRTLSAKWPTDLVMKKGPARDAEPPGGF